MTVIKKEYISRDIVRSDLLPLSFLKRSAYTGSKFGLRFRLERAEKEPEGEGGEKEVYIRCLYWPGPFAYDHAAKESIGEEDFPFSEEGLLSICSFLSSRLHELEGEI
ncbi:MAG TPA: hypothetical protein IAB10_05235 [Candidatus Avilachnospira avistercoris]|nr:hypothetical protein [Candidatus Avilachnospira avistercoris]